MGVLSVLTKRLTGVARVPTRVGPWVVSWVVAVAIVAISNNLCSILQHECELLRAGKVESQSSTFNLRTSSGVKQEDSFMQFVGPMFLMKHNSREVVNAGVAARVNDILAERVLVN